MEFNEKLQELRKRNGLTQEELAEKLYVSRTAISKWESGKGYPSIDSLKAISQFFSVTLDELLSSDEILTIANEEKNQTKNHFCDLTFGLLDISVILLLFLPLFGVNKNGVISETTLLLLDGVSLYLKIFYIVIVALIFVWGVLLLVLQNNSSPTWANIKTKLSLTLGVIAVLLFIVSKQPYAAAFVFVFLIIKVLVSIKRS